MVKEQLYISTFPAGFERPVRTILEGRLQGFICKRSEEGMLLYQCSAPLNQVRQLSCVSNTFRVLHSVSFRSDTPLADLLKQLGDAKITRHFFSRSHLRAKTFRIMGYQHNQPAQLPRRELAQLERTISTLTGMYPARAGAQLEFWCYARRGGESYFLQRLTKRQGTEKQRLKGELAPEIAEVLCHLSQPNANDIFLDCFFGHGAIALARLKLPFKMIFCGDNEQGLIRELRDRIKRALPKKSSLLKKIIVYQGDALRLTRFEDNFITKIVSDPPWGLFKELPGGPRRFYTDFLSAAFRVLAPDGTLILLTAQKEITTTVAAKQGFSLTASYDVLISGKKAGVFVLQKPGLDITTT